MAKAKSTKPQCGDDVRFTIGASVFHGRVVEDRGCLGVGGRRLWRITTATDGNGDAFIIELPEESFRVVSRPGAAPPPDRRPVGRFRPKHGYTSYRTGDYWVYLGRDPYDRLVFVKPFSGDVERLVASEALDCFDPAARQGPDNDVYDEWSKVKDSPRII
jgi:hypothetical protein